MSVCSKYFGCLNGDPSWEAVIKALSVEDDDGNQFINICFTDRDSCYNDEQEAAYTSAFDCLQEATLSDILELIVGEDECGHPAINVLANVCESCSDAGGDPGQV